MKALLCILALLLATPAWAGDECHVPSSVPIVTNWTITAGPGTIVIDATLSSECCPPREYYWDRKDGYNGYWWMICAVGERYVRMDDLDMSKASVTDSTFHVEISHEAGTFDYNACVRGTDHHAQECTCGYEMEGTLTILPGMTPTRRVSYGGLKVLYR